MCLRRFSFTKHSEPGLWTMLLLLALSSCSLTSCGKQSNGSAPVSPSPPVAAAGSIEVGPNVQLSREHPNLQYTEVIMGADPRDARRLIACSIIAPSPSG